MKRVAAVLLVCAGLAWAGFASGFVGPRPTWQEIYEKKSSMARGWKYIVLHHSATAAGSAAAFHRYHTKMGYGGLCYHFVIGNGNGAPDGHIEEGFRWKSQMAGTHVDVNSWYHNIFGIGICLVGNLDQSPPTPKQVAALKGLVQRLCSEYGIPRENVLGHNQVPFGEMSWDRRAVHVSFKGQRTAATKCPGRFLPDLFETQAKSGG